MNMPIWLPSVGLANVAAEELHHAEDFAAQQHRKPKSGVQAFTRGRGGARKICVVHDVGDPRRLAGGPHAARKADPA
jgi:hypothetical protein